MASDGSRKGQRNQWKINISATWRKKIFEIIEKALGKQWFAKHGIGRIAQRSIKPMENQHFCIVGKENIQNHWKSIRKTMVCETWNRTDREKVNETHGKSTLLHRRKSNCSKSLKSIRKTMACATWNRTDRDKVNETNGRSTVLHRWQKTGLYSIQLHRAHL